MEKICSKGHVFFKSSDCPVCPKCSNEEKEKEVVFHFLAAPAQRALKNKGVVSLEDLMQFSEKELMNMHGFGKSALNTLKLHLEKNNVSFRES